MVFPKETTFRKYERTVTERYLRRRQLSYRYLCWLESSLVLCLPHVSLRLRCCSCSMSRAGLQIAVVVAAVVVGVARSTSTFVLSGHGLTRAGVAAAAEWNRDVEL